jgi:glycosyltransferase involved in cell wall biosynthesis
MDVSIVIPTRDRPELLALTLCTVLYQQGVDLEVVVVDDGAEAGTSSLIQAICDRRVRLLRNTGRPGVSGARNCGIAAAHGRWIAFLDDDDLWAPTKLVAQLAAASEMRAGWVYAGDVTVDAALRVRHGARPPGPDEVLAALRHHNAVPAGASNVMVRRDVLEATGRFDPELRTSEDWDLWLRLAANGRPACVAQPLVALRTHSRMASRAVDVMLSDLNVIARRHRIPVDRARHERWAAWMCLEDGRRGAALLHYSRAVIAGDPMSLGRAAVALLAPRLARREQPVTHAWAIEAQGWLDAVAAMGVTRQFPGCGRR